MRTVNDVLRNVEDVCRKHIERKKAAVCLARLTILAEKSEKRFYDGLSDVATICVNLDQRNACFEVPVKSKKHGAGRAKVTLQITDLRWDDREPV